MQRGVMSDIAFVTRVRSHMVTTASERGHSAHSLDKHADERIPQPFFVAGWQATARGVARNIAAALSGGAPKPILRADGPDIMLPDLAGTAVLVRERRLILSGRVPLLLRSTAEHRYLRSRKAN